MHSVRSQLPAVTTLAGGAAVASPEFDVAVCGKPWPCSPTGWAAAAKRCRGPSKRTYRAIYRWNAQRDKFELTASDLKRLDRENKKLMSGGD